MKRSKFHLINYIFTSPPIPNDIALQPNVNTSWLVWIVEEEKNR